MATKSDLESGFPYVDLGEGLRQAVTPRLSKFRRELAPFAARITFGSPVDSARFDDVKVMLDVEIPEDLRDFLSEADGVLDEYAAPLVWDLETMIDENLEFRKNADFKNLYMPFDAMLFFGAGGNGDLFFFPIQNKKVRNRGVFRWDHETDSRSKIAPSLNQFLVRALNGQIRI
jgi:hypothetical protein